MQQQLLHLLDFIRFYWVLDYYQEIFSLEYEFIKSVLLQKSLISFQLEIQLDRSIQPLNDQESKIQCYEKFLLTCPRDNCLGCEKLS